MTKDRIISIFWGVVLIALGGLWLAGKMEYIQFDLFSEQAWVIIFAVASAAFFLSYFLNGLRQWGWLFPAFICAALALTIWMATHEVDGSIVGVPILASVALPFYVGFAVDRKSWGLLIPAWVMTVISAIVLFADIARGEWIGALVMYGIALPFLVVYLLNRSHKWALIPAGINAGIGTIPLLVALFGDSEAIALGLMLLFALPFFVVYFWSKSSWWALIPAGVFVSIGAVVLLTLLVRGDPAWLEGAGTGVLLLGFGLTFGVLWLRRATQPTDWAKYPAAGLLAAAVAAFVLGRNFENFWAVALIVVGVMLLLASLLPKREKGPPKPGDQA